MKMSADELEYAISQYLDGTLPPLERSALDERLAADPVARAMLEQYRRLNSALKGGLPEMSAVAWDRLAGTIQQSVAAEELPVRHYSIRSISWTGRLAVAASLLAAIGIATFFIERGTEKPAAQGLAIISGPQAQQSRGPVLSNISIGPSPTMANIWHPGQEVVSRPTVVLIDSAHISGQDSDSSLY